MSFWSNKFFTGIIYLSILKRKGDRGNSSGYFRDLQYIMGGMKTYLSPCRTLWYPYGKNSLALEDLAPSFSSEDVLFSNWEDHTHYGGNMKRRRQKLINIHTAKMTRQLLFGAHLTTKTWCHTFNLKESPWWCPSSQPKSQCRLSVGPA